MTGTLADVPPAVVPIGIFDGVHRGHQLVLAHAVEAARARGGEVVVVTFDPHPVAVLRPQSVPLMLTTIERRVELLRQHGADRVVVVAFTEERSQQSAEDFIAHTLVEEAGGVAVVVGTNFRFGHKAAGDAALLRRSGLEVDELALLADGEVISSTLIRALVADGDVAAAARALGRRHIVEGMVVRGDARGRELGFPTANVAVREGIAIPQDGVYAGYLVRASGKRGTAAISIGTNPTFDGQTRRVEAYVIDEGHELDLYDTYVVVEFAERLRGMERFDSIDALVAQMAKDVADTRTRLH